MRDNRHDTPLIQRIPDPQSVRENLARHIRQTKLLRQLLKLSERAAREREGSKGVANAR